MGPFLAALRWEQRAKGPWLYDRLFPIPTNFLAEREFNSIQLGFIMDFSAHSIIWTILVGLVIGAIAKLLMPGKDPVVASSRFCWVSPAHW